MDNICNEKTTEKKIIYLALLVNTSFTIKLVGGIYANSLTLLSNSLYLIPDLIALFIWISKINNIDYRDTHRQIHHRNLILLIMNILLIGILMFIAGKYMLKYLNVFEVGPIKMLFVSGIGIMVNFVIVFILRRSERKINNRNIFIHFWGNMIINITVFVGAIIIYRTDIVWIDKLLSGVILVIILRTILKLILEYIEYFLKSCRIKFIYK